MHIIRYAPRHHQHQGIPRHRCAGYPRPGPEGCTGTHPSPRSGLLCRRPRRRPADRGHPGRPPRRSHLAQLENLWGFGGLRRLRWSWVLPIGRYLSEIWGDSIMKSKAKQRFQLAKVSIGRIDTEGWDCFTNSVGESSPTQWRLGCGPIRHGRCS